MSRIDDYFKSVADTTAPASAPAPVTINNITNNITNNNHFYNAPGSSRPRRDAASRGERKRRARGCEDESESESEEGEEDEEEETESEPEPAKKKRRRDKNGKLRKTPAQNQKCMHNQVEATRKAYAQERNTTAYTDTKSNLVRGVVAKIGVPRNDMKFTMNKQLANAIPRVKIERLTYGKNGQLTVEVDDGNENNVNRMVMKKIISMLTDEDKLLASDFIALVPIPEHKSRNKLNYSHSNVYMSVLGVTNSKFKSGGSSKYPGVSSKKKMKKKWQVHIRASPGQKRKHYGCFYSEVAAFKHALKIWDAGYAPARFAPYRSAIIFYNDDGKLAPYFKVFDSFTEMAKLLRPDLFVD